MQYLINHLVLGDVLVALDDLHKNGFENTEKGEISRWEREFHRKDTDITLIIDVPVITNAPFEEIIPQSEGIIYYLNPNDPTKVELFKDMIKLIKEVNPNAPVVVVIHNFGGDFKLNINDIFAWLWSEYGSETWYFNRRYKSPLMEIINALIDSLIYGNILLNFETAWMQIPVLKQKINNDIERQNWAHAARLTEKLAHIYNLLQKQDWAIIAEKSGWLYIQNREYLPASNILLKVNKTIAEKYRILYYEDLVHQGKIYFKKGISSLAADYFEKAAKWAKLGLLDDELYKKAIKLSIIARIKALQIPSALDGLNNLDEIETKRLFTENSELIIDALKDQMNNGDLSEAKSNIYLIIQKFQKLGLFEQLKTIVKMAAETLKRLLKNELKERNSDQAKIVFDELENIIESYKLEHENIDPLTAELASLFIERHDFQMVDLLLNKIKDNALKSKITEDRMKEEENIIIRQKTGKKQYERQILEKIRNYINYEHKLFDDYVKKVIDNARSYENEREFLKATRILEEIIDQLKHLRKKTFLNKISFYMLTLLLKGKFMGKFLNEISELPEDLCKKYLNENFDLIKSTVLEIKNQINIKEFEQNLMELIKLYRSHLLYSESKELVQILINSLIDYGVNINKPDEAKESEYIRTIHSLMGKITHLSQSFLDDSFELNIDPLIKLIIPIYINKRDLVNARKYIERLKDLSSARDFNEQIEKIESESSLLKTEKIKKKKEIKNISELLQDLAMEARKNPHYKENLLRMRNSLRNFYFKDSLELLKNENPIDAITLYKKNIKRLINVKKYELAGINLAVFSILNLMIKKPYKVKEYIEKLDNELGLTAKIFHQTYPVRLVDTLIKILKNKEISYLNRILNLFDNLALFPEEKLLLKTLLGENTDFKEILAEHDSILESPGIHPSDRHKILIEQIQRDPHQYSKRMALENKYWSRCRDLFAQQQYFDAYQTYISIVEDLFTRTEKEFGMISIIMAFLSLYKIRSPDEIGHLFEKFKFKMEREHPHLAKSPELKMLDILFFAENNQKNIERKIEILSTFKEKLALFDWEKSLIDALISSLNRSADTKNLPKMEGKIGIENAASTADASLLQDQLIILTQDVAKNRDKLEELFQNRKMMVRTYYQGILENIKNKQYGEAAEQYKKLVKRFARRNDFEKAGLMALLFILSLLKADIDEQKIKEQFTQLMKSLGQARNILEFTLFIRLANCLLDSVSFNEKEMIYHISGLLRQIPLFDEERNLIPE